MCCTHCTYGTSALERREDASADEVLGYSVRAGSLAPADLQTYYGRFERYLYYQLPEHTPKSQRLRFTAGDAPKRLLYLPSVDGLPMLAHVCYRPKDTAGRPGSYFAHVLFCRKQTGTLFSPLECLKLWAAPKWALEDADRDTLPFRMQSLGTLAKMHPGGLPSISEQTFKSFLTDESTFDDPANSIPARWRESRPEERQQWFIVAFGGLMEILRAERKTLFLVAEPEFAALLFYGMLRLLPEGPIQRELGFSTFEPSPDRVYTRMVATRSHDSSQRVFLNPGEYRSRGFVVDTFHWDCHTQLGGARTCYAPWIVSRLLEKDWPAVNDAQAVMRAVGGADVLSIQQQLDQLEQWPGIYQDALDVVRGRVSRPTPQARPLAERFPALLPQIIDRELAFENNKPPRTAEVVLSIDRRLAESLVAWGQSQLDDTVRCVLDALSVHDLAQLLDCSKMPARHLVCAVRRYIEEQRRLPDDSELLWQRPFPPHDYLEMPLMSQSLGGLDPVVVKQLSSNVPEKDFPQFLFCLQRACRLEPALQSVLSDLVRKLDEQVLMEMDATFGPSFFQEYPPDEAVLGRRLEEIARTLHHSKQGFSARLDMLLHGVDLLPTEPDRKMVRQWEACRSEISEIAVLKRSQAPGQPPALPGKLGDHYEMMARHANAAMANTVRDDKLGTQRRNHLLDIAKHLLARPLLNDKLEWDRKILAAITRVFQGKVWPRSLDEIQPSEHGSSGKWIYWAVSLIVAAIVAVVVLTALGLISV